MTDPCTLSLTECSELIRKGRLSPAALLQACRERIAALEGEVRAWARLCEERAASEAASLEAELAAGKPRGPLHGIPFGAKDIYHTRGVETSAATPILSGFIPQADAEVVANLKAAGAILLGKTETTQFAFMDPAPTKNPWNLAHTPGGSSSGSAAAVACGMVPFALGTQTGGSVLRPSAYCGIAGLKPTYGRLSRKGIIPLAFSLDHPGVMARRARDLAPLFLAAAGLKGSTRPLLAVSMRGLVAGVPDRYFSERMSPETAKAFEAALKVLEGLGAVVKTVVLPKSFEASVDAAKVIFEAEAASFHQRWYPARKDDYGPKLAALIETGLAHSATAYIRARHALTAATRDMRGLFSDCLVVLTPTTPAPAPAGFATTGDPSFNAPVSAFGFPAATVPMGFDGAGLPMGLQVFSDLNAEAAVLSVAAAFEDGTGYWKERPKL